MTDHCVLFASPTPHMVEGARSSDNTALLDEDEANGRGQVSWGRGLTQGVSEREDTNTIWGWGVPGKSEGF